jgi:hypothetical protein
MPQAEKSNTPIPSRRAVLTTAVAGAALAGAAGVNVAAIALAAPARVLADGIGDGDAGAHLPVGAPLLGCP